jgi:hypothetical protein
MTGTDKDRTEGKDQTEGRDQTEGLAQQSLNTSVVQPGQGGTGGPGHGERGLTANDQRRGLERTQRSRPDAEDHR